MFIFASLAISLGINTSRLHEKLALKICMITGSDPKWILLSIMSVTCFLSLWISNSTTTSMILPIAISLAKQLVKLDSDFQEDNDNTSIKIEMEADKTDEKLFESKKAQNLIKAFCLSITYSATIGGFGSLIGASSNIVLKDYMDLKHPNNNLNFFTFLLFAFPVSILLVVSCWLTLCLMWFPKG